MAPTAVTNDFDDLTYRQMQQKQTQSTSQTEAPFGRMQPVRDVIVSFLQRCRIPYPYVPYDHQLDAETREDCRKRGLPLEGPTSMGPFIAGGVAMASTAYKHLPNRATQVLTCTYTVFLIYLDDIFNENIDAVREFNERFVNREPQGHTILDGFAQLLLEIPQHYNRVVSNIMITSTLNLVTALLLEYETQGMALRSGAKGYPTFSRVMSGASETYALFQFPKELPLRSYIQALPELMTFINNGNDILSFYKEESDKEVVNRVSYIADCNSISKVEALKLLEDEAVTACNRVEQVLEPHPEAARCFECFKHGYVGFHSGAKRYRLAELKL